MEKRNERKERSDGEREEESQIRAPFFNVTKVTCVTAVADCPIPPSILSAGLAASALLGLAPLSGSASSSSSPA